MVQVVLSCVILAVLVLIPQALCQVTLWGTCQDVKVKTDFVSSKYIGKWYEIQKYPFIFTLFGRCTTAEYGANADGTISVLNKQLGIFGYPTTISGTVTVLSPGKLNVAFPSVPQTTKEANYLVLDTDYTSYAVVFSCRNNYYNLTSSRVAFILSRTKIMPLATLTKARAVLTANGISTFYLTSTDQLFCPASN